jgi:hypothetical protein
VRRAIAATVGLTAVLWVPTAFDQLSAERGNLTAMAEAADRPGAGARARPTGPGLVALQLGWEAPWLGWSTPRAFLESTVDPSAAPLAPVGAVALLGALVVAVRRRLDARWLALAATIAAVAGVLALSRLIGPAFIWIPQWTRVIGFAAWAAVGWVAATALRRSIRDRWRTPVSAVLLLALVGTSSIHAWQTATYDRADDPVGRVVTELFRQAEPTIRGLPEPVLVSSTASPLLVFGTESVGIEILVLTLERAGIATAVDRSVADRFGSERARPELAAAELQLALQRDPVPDGYRIIATADPLTPTERAERLALLQSIGLGDDADASDIFQRLFDDPSVRPVFDRLGAYTDLPPFVLLLADPAA